MTSAIEEKLERRQLRALRKDSREFLREITAKRNRIRQKLKELDYLEKCCREKIAECERLLVDEKDEEMFEASAL